MNILFLSDNFPPEVNAPASRTHEHCREWRRMGHQVTVVTCVPNFPTGRIFDGYRNHLWQWEEIDGIRVLRVWTYIAANEGFARRTLDYMSFMVMAVVLLPLAGKFDIVVATSPQIFATCAGFIAGILRRRPFVFELRDLWPESIKAVGAIKSRAVLRWLERLELFLYRHATAVVCVTQAFRANLIGRGIDGNKITVVTNGADLSRFSPRPKDLDLARKFGLEGKFVVGYVGTHGMAHALETVLEAAARLRGTPEEDTIRFVLLGDGAQKASLKQKAASMGLDTVLFIDSVPKNEVVRYWSLLDISIIHLKRTELFSTVIPSKLFESMAMGIPVLLGVAGESAAIVECDGVGLVFESENDLALAEGVVRMAKDVATRQQFAQHGPMAAVHYDRTQLAHQMLEALQRVAARPAGDEVASGV